MAYLLLAFTWWAILLFTKNQDAFRAKTEYLKLIYVAEQKTTNLVEFENTLKFKALEIEYNRQEWMIFGEVSVFAITLIVGLLLINRAYNQRLKTIRQQRNFLLSVTHELKTPITSIRLMLETIRMRPLERDKLNLLSDNAINDTDRLNSLVNNLLYSAKIDSLGSINKEQIDLIPIIKESINNISRKYPKSEINDYHDQKENLIIGDLASLKMLFDNLLDNALKYSENQKVVIQSRQENAHTIIEIKDFGKGIPKQERSRVFEQFYRIGDEDTRSSSGTGLGLFICKSIVDNHGGTIKIKDNHPVGTIIEIKLLNE